MQNYFIQTKQDALNEKEMEYFNIQEDMQNNQAKLVSYMKE